MSHLLSDDFVKKFQLTDSFLRRVLHVSEYERLKVVEPVIVATDDINSKQLRNPGYKHAVVSSNFLYVVNTPAKSKSDLIFKIALEKINAIQLIHDVADFLQGKLQMDTQHIQLLCTYSSNNVADGLLASLEPMSSSSKSESKDYLSIPPVTSKEINSDTNIFSNPSARSFIHPKSTQGFSNKRIIRSDLSSTDVPCKNSSLRRPLPRPLCGTETLNASYTSSMIKAKLEICNSSLNSRCLSPSRSLDNILKESCDDATSFESSYSSKSKKFSMSHSLSKSWSNVFQEALNGRICEGTDLAESKENQKTRNKDLTPYEVGLNLSMSSNSFGGFKRTQEKLYSDSIQSSQNTTSISTSIMSQKFREEKKESYGIDLYTVDKASILFNILRESWLNALIDATMLLKIEEDSLHKIPSKRSTLDPAIDVITQKFTMLTEELTSLEEDHELFLLTKELKSACEKYFFLKKLIWKFGDVLNMYLQALKRLISSKSQDLALRMDELDVMIIICEFFISIFQGTELVPTRNSFLNENSALFTKELLFCVVSQPVVNCVRVDRELIGLLESSKEKSLLLLYELVNAASLTASNCVSQKSFNITLVANFLLHTEEKLTHLMDYAFQYLTKILSTTIHEKMSPVAACCFYKFLFVIQFICNHCEALTQNIKEKYQEEIKYYLGKIENLVRIPGYYPIVQPLSVLFESVASSLTL